MLGTFFILAAPNFHVVRMSHLDLQMVEVGLQGDLPRVICDLDAFVDASFDVQTPLALAFITPPGEGDQYAIEGVGQLGAIMVLTTRPRKNYSGRTYPQEKCVARRAGAVTRRWAC